MTNIENEKALNLVKARAELKAQIEALTEKVKECEVSIEEELGEGRFHLGGYSVTCGDREQSRFDTTSFKKDNPEVYAAYCKTSKSHFFMAKEIKLI